MPVRRGGGAAPPGELVGADASFKPMDLPDYGGRPFAAIIESPHETVRLQTRRTDWRLDVTPTRNPIRAAFPPTYWVLSNCRLAALLREVESTVAWYPIRACDQGRRFQVCSDR